MPVHGYRKMAILQEPDPWGSEKSNSWQGQAPQIIPGDWEYCPNAAWALLGWCCDQFPGDPVSVLKHPLGEEPFPISNLNLAWYSFMLFPQLLSLVTREKGCGLLYCLLSVKGIKTVHVMEICRHFCSYAMYWQVKHLTSKGFLTLLNMPISLKLGICLLLSQSPSFTVEAVYVRLNITCVKLH